MEGTKKRGRGGGRGGGVKKEKVIKTPKVLGRPRGRPRTKVRNPEEEELYYQRKLNAKNKRRLKNFTVEEEAALAYAASKGLGSKAGLMTGQTLDPALGDGGVEEHFVLRMPPTGAAILRKSLASKDFSPQDFALSMRDGRHGKVTLGLGNGMVKNFRTTLVDLPCILESLKTLDNKQYYKIADIAQMMIAEEEPDSSQASSKKKPAPSSTSATLAGLGRDFSWPDGVVEVLRDVRNSRFRKRMNKKIVEDVELEIERLLSADYEAEDVKYEVLERKENEDDEALDEEEESSEDEGRGAVKGGGGGSDEGDDDFDAAFDEAFEKLEEGEGEGGEGGEGDDEESDDESGSDDEEEEEDPDEKNEENELKIQANSLRHEIAALEVKLGEKNEQVSNQVNLIMKERFKGIVEKLSRELELKREQLEKLNEELEEEEGEGGN